MKYILMFIFFSISCYEEKLLNAPSTVNTSIQQSYLHGQWITENDFYPPLFREVLKYDSISNNTGTLSWSLYLWNDTLYTNILGYDSLLYVVELVNGYDTFWRLNLDNVYTHQKDFVTIIAGNTMWVVSYNDNSLFKYLDGFYIKEKE